MTNYMADAIKIGKNAGRLPPNCGKGRPKGVKNKSTESMRKAWIEAFDNLGGIPSLVRWGKQNPDDFYKCASKLIPLQTEVSGPDGGPVQQLTEIRINLVEPKNDGS